MTSRLAFLALVLMVSAAAVPAAAWPGEAGEWDAELKFRYGWPKAQDGGVELFDGAYGGEVAVTRRMAERWTLGVGYNLVKLDATGAFRGDYFVENGEVENGGYRQQTLFVMARYDVQESVLNPFLAAGVGTAKIHHTQGGGGFSGWGTDLIARGGMAYRLSEKLGIVGELTYDVLMGEETDVKTLAVQAGVTYGF